MEESAKVEEAKLLNPSKDAPHDPLQDENRMNSLNSSSELALNIDLDEAIEEAYQQAGGFAKLQWFANMIFACGWNAQSIWWSNIYTLLLAPAYQCKYKGEENYEDCDQDTICDSDGGSLQYRIDWSQPQSLHNWFEKFDLLCDYQFVKMAPFSFFAAQALVVWWAPRLTDRIGRKKIVQVFSATTTILYSVMIFTKNKYVLLVMIVL